MHLTLLPFSEDYAVEIAGWPRDASELKAWAGVDAVFPFKPEQFRIWHDDSETHAFVAECNDKLVAYGELWVDELEQEIELARIIVDPAHRTMGIGQAFVTALVAHSETYGFDHRFLRVLPENTIAIRCYKKAGFERLSADDQRLFNQGQLVEYVWMKYVPHHKNNKSL